MAWDKVCLAFEMGRLGIRKIVFFNHVLLGKLLWRFGHEVSHLWQLLPLNMERVRGGWSTKVCRRAHGCELWRSISEGWESFSQHLAFVVGDVNQIHLYM